MPDVCGQVARELSLDPGQVEAIVRLLDDGNTFLRGLQQHKEDLGGPSTSRASSPWNRGWPRSRS